MKLQDSSHDNGYPLHVIGDEAGYPMFVNTVL